MFLIGCGYDDAVGKLLPLLGGPSLIDLISFLRDARDSLARHLDPDYYSSPTLGGDIARRKSLRGTQRAFVDDEMPARPQRLEQWTSLYQRMAMQAVEWGTVLANALPLHNRTTLGKP